MSNSFIALVMESEREGSPNESNANVDLEKNKLRIVLLLFDAFVAGKSR